MSATACCVPVLAADSLEPWFIILAIINHNANFAFLSFPKAFSKPNCLAHSCSTHTDPKVFPCVRESSFFMEPSCDRSCLCFSDSSNAVIPILKKKC